MQPAQGPQAVEKACKYLTAADAEAILGQPVVLQNENDDDCWFAQQGFVAGMNHPNDKQVQVHIFRSTSPHPGDLNGRRAQAAQARMTVTDLPGFADAAIWQRGGDYGELHAFRSGTLEVVVRIGGMPEDAALQHAKEVAAKALGGTQSSGFAYEGAAVAKAARAAAATVQSPAAYRESWMGQKMTFRGTVARLNLDTSRFPRWLTIYFRESPDGSFVACSPYPDMIEDSLGQLSALVGKTLQISGTVEGALCHGGQGASINLSASDQFSVVGGPAAGHVVVASGVPSAHLQGARVGLDVCNAGEVAFDAIVAAHGRTSSAHLAPRDCAHLYEQNGGPAYVGFAFNDKSGKWGAPRRIDLLPNGFGSYNAPTGVWAASSERVSVPHGGGAVLLPTQMEFQPPAAHCITRERHHTEINYMFKPGDPRYATEVSDGTSTTCDSFDYALNVTAYADTHEVGFERKCPDCPLGNPTLETPAQRTGTMQTLMAMGRISPLAGQIMGGAAMHEEEKDLQQSVAGQKEFRRMSWPEIDQAIAMVPGGGAKPPGMPDYLVMRGTVARVELSADAGSHPRIDIYFREAPQEQQAFNVCTSAPEILAEMFGPDYRTRMVGQVVEVEGAYQRSFCRGLKGSIRIALAHQIRKAGP